MRMAVVYQYYMGLDSPGHSVLFDLTQYLARHGHDVTVVSGETGYMRPDKCKMPWYRRVVRSEEAGKVKVIRTFTYSELHRSYLGRLWSFISFAISCPIGLIKIKRPHVVLASSPPIVPMLSVLVICKLRRIPLVFEVRDLWPASAVQMGILKNKQMITILEWLERLLYRQSTKIVALTEGIAKNICGRGFPPEKVRVITCGVDFDRLYPDKSEGEITRQSRGWGRKKIVMYFGALGEANNIPVILRAAERLRHRDDILFVLIGDGMKRREVEQYVCERNLINVKIGAPVPKELARGVINAATVCVVSLQDIALFEGAIPTKLIDYMACAKPVLCGIRGEAKRIVDEAGAGLTFDPDDDEQLAQCISEIITNKDLCDEMGERGLVFVRDRFSAEKSRQKMEAILLAAANSDEARISL